jgi:hypothetical protein
VPALVENPPWVDRALKDSWGIIKAVDLPPPAEFELGCGHYGCVFSTLDSEIVVKITSDESEAEFVKMAEPLGWPSGMVKYYKITQLEGTYRNREIFALWREAAFNVGDCCPYRKPKDLEDWDYRERKQFEIRLLQFREAASIVRDSIRRSKNPVKLFKEAKKQEEWAWDYVDSAELINASLTATVRRLKFQVGAARVAVALRACALFAELMEHEHLASEVGQALGFYLEHKMLLADVHLGNVGQVDRGDGYAPWVITDPGHLVVLD